MIKNKIKIRIAGAVISFLGVIGLVLEQIGLCFCIIPSIMSLLGIMSILTYFLYDKSIYLLGIGLVLLIIGILFWNTKPCRIHSTKNNKKAEVHK